MLNSEHQPFIKSAIDVTCVNRDFSLLKQRFKYTFYHGWPFRLYLYQGYHFVNGFVIHCYDKSDVCKLNWSVTNFDVTGISLAYIILQLGY